MNEQQQSENERLLQNIIRIGLISKVDYPAKKIKVNDGDLDTHWLDWPCEVGRNYRRWRPLRVGTQVILASTCGDTNQAKVIGMLYTEAIPSPSDDPDVDLIEFNDGAKLEYNISTGNMHIKAINNLTLEAEHHYIKGPVTQTGGDMSSGGIFVQHHGHKNVESGSSTSGKPVS